MPYFNSNLHISQGVTFRRSFIWKSGGQVVDLTGYKAKAQIGLTASSNAVIYEMTTENGKIEIDGPKGMISLLIPASVTETFEFNVTGAVYDVELYHPTDADEVISFVGGLVKLYLQVTR